MRGSHKPLSLVFDPHRMNENGLMNMINRKSDGYSRMKGGGGWGGDGG